MRPAPRMPIRDLAETARRGEPTRSRQSRCVFRYRMLVVTGAASRLCAQAAPDFRRRTWTSFFPLSVPRGETSSRTDGTSSAAEEAFACTVAVVARTGAAASRTADLVGAANADTPPEVAGAAAGALPAGAT